MVRIQTDAGVISHVESIYCREIITGMIHGMIARRLFGENALVGMGTAVPV